MVFCQPKPNGSYRLESFVRFLTTISANSSLIVDRERIEFRPIRASVERERARRVYPIRHILYSYMNSLSS